MQGISRLVPRWLAILVFATWGLILACAVVAPPSQSNLENPVSARADVADTTGLYDVLWLDKYPEMQHDTWKAYLFTSDNVGINVDGLSAFKLTLEIFEFKADKTNCKFHFPHNGRRAGCPITVEKMKKPTKHFDVQLTVTNDPQNAGITKTYFSGPEFRSTATLPSWLRDSLESTGASKYLDHLENDNQ